MLDMYRMFVVPEGKSGEKGAKMMVDLGDAMAREAIPFLGLGQKDRVIEIGFGPGIGLETLVKTVSQGTIVGIDPSELMHRLASERNKDSIVSGKITLIKGTVENLPFDDDYFNGAIAMDNMHFWNEPLNGLTELKRVLLPGSKLVCSFTPHSGGSKHGWEKLFERAGYVDFTLLESALGIRIVAKIPEISV
ncbi:methyltransferase domain-containing protein [Sphingobacterium psychroaquaticum]|uniref:class I SAM-dependent methyltransferase n=1 Tax=Sphingobacterium psychroaquaticum TaxID=561061 RepID=UPI00106A7B4E|nr:class I SAM-dependent methyltransferase [Sphingobacterium psychroaquaticum]QBQ41781.1 methyltransferase domain-containing protein [Sphingobacterium psychroaquaticum]